LVSADHSAARRSHLYAVSTALHPSASGVGPSLRDRGGSVTSHRRAEAPGQPQRLTDPISATIARSERAADRSTPTIDRSTAFSGRGGGSNFSEGAGRGGAPGLDSSNLQRFFLGFPPKLQNLAPNRVCGRSRFVRGRFWSGSRRSRRGSASIGGGSVARGGRVPAGRGRAEAAFRAPEVLRRFRAAIGYLWRLDSTRPTRPPRSRSIREKRRFHGASPDYPGLSDVFG
jgi:hypothetical protein